MQPSAVTLFVTLALAAQTSTAVPPDLAALADAERAFAARAREVGWRDAFLEYFAEDAVAFSPGPGPAREGLLNLPSVPFAEQQLTWEPRLGDIAASGELGWLTGPAVLVVPKGQDRTPRHQTYLSIWRRQPGGPWRVLVDVGVPNPEAPSFAPGFSRFVMPERNTPGSAEGESPGIAAADRALNERLAREGQAAGYAPFLVEGTRFHRARVMPLVGRDAILASLTSAPDYTGTSMSSETAASGDLGFSYGVYRGGESGAYLRIWQRRADGAWALAVDLRRPDR